MKARYLVCIIVVLVAAYSWGPISAHAHAYKIGAEPEPGTSVDTSPERIVVEFSEGIEPRGSRIQLLRPDGEEVALGERTVAPDDLRRLIVAVEEELAHGTYTVVWQSVSAVDGHPLRGHFLFAVGEPLAAEAVAPGADAAGVASPLQGIGRWLTLLGIAAVIGALVLHLIVFGPSLHERGPLAFLSDRLSARRWLVVGTGAGLFLAGSVGELLGQAQVLGGAPVSMVIGETAWGSSWLWRMGIWLVMVACLFVGLRFSRNRSSTSEAKESESPMSGPVPLLVALAAVLAIALTSHVATGTAVRTPGLVNHFLHMIASSVWVGGVFYLVLATPLVLRAIPSEQLPRVLPAILDRFWALAIVCIVTLFLSGLYNFWVQVTVPAALATPYGETLVVKVLLVIALFCVAGAELLWIRPKLRGDSGAPRLLGHVFKGETAVAVLVILAVGFLASTEPAGQAADRTGLLDPDRETTFSAEDEGTEITMTVEPGVVGRNRLIFDLVEVVGNRIDADEVTVAIRNLPQESIDLNFSASPVGDGRYVVERVAFTLAGRWRADVEVRRPGAFDARTGFEFQVVEEAVRRADLLSAGTAWLLLIGQLAVIGLLIGVLRYSGRSGSRGSRSHSAFTHS